MANHKYTSIPILNNDGGYVGTLSEGDLLWYCHSHKLSCDRPDLLYLTKIPRRFDYAPVSVNSNIEDLLTKITQQNFVPVVDDCDKFIGIVTRSDIIQYLSKSAIKLS